METPEKSPAPVDSPSRCFFRHVVTLAMKTSLQSCAPSGHAIVLASAKAPALIKPGEMDYAAGSRFIALPGAIDADPRRFIKVASVGVAPAPPPAGASAPEVIADLRNHIPFTDDQGRHIEITVSASY